MTSVIELEDRVTTRSQPEQRLAEEQLPSQSVQSLQPTDSGTAAWRVLLAAFVFEGVLWGFPLSFGVFQQYYTNLPEFSNSRSITYIGVVATGIVYLGAPIMAPLVKLFPQHQRLMISFGWLLCVISLIAGSFSTTITGLILTQGVVYGVGYLLIFYAVVNMVNEWWVTRRGFAWGIMLGSSGVAGVVYPFIIQALLQNYGYHTTLQAMAIATIVLTGPLIPLLKGRLPPSRDAVLVRTDWSFILKPLFWAYLMSTITQSLGFYLPIYYLPAYASATGLSSRIGALLIALVNVASVLGQLTYGYLSDRRVPLRMLLLSTTIIASVSSLTLWGLAQSATFLVLFALIYGFFAYAYLAMRVRIGTAVTADTNDSMTIFCIFSFGQGIGNVLAGPISGALLGNDLDKHEYGYARYKALVIFTGVAMVASAACISLSYLIPAKLRTESRVYD